MAPNPTSIHLGPGLTAREAAIDAIHRFTQALDDNDTILLRSCITSDAMVDRSGLSAVIGQELPPTPGIELIEKFVLGTVGPLDTSHQVSNIRVKLNEHGKAAEVTCCVIAEHYRLGDGKDPQKSVRLSVCSRYRADVVEDEKERLWKIKKVHLVALWSAGDLRVFGM